MPKNNYSEYANRFIVETTTFKLLDSEKKLLEELQPAGLMLRSRNFRQDQPYEVWFKEYEAYLHDLFQILDQKKTILCIDHEGGLIIRPPAPITRFPYPAHWQEHSGQVAKSIATELQSLGINLIFAPSADINTNPGNPIIGERAFSCETNDVCQKALEFSEIMLQENILPCAKHFPGHGDTNQDSHTDFIELQCSEQDLLNRELIPFQKLIEQNIPAILTAHLNFPKLDADNIVTYSEYFLHQLLRHKLQFNGVIISDALCMKPILDTLHDRTSTIKAINAGLDFFLIAGPNTDLSLAKTMIDYIQQGFKNNEIDQINLEKSNNRIEQFLSSLPVNQTNFLKQSIFDKHAELNKLLRTKMKANQDADSFRDKIITD